MTHRLDDETLNSVISDEAFIEMIMRDLETVKQHIERGDVDTAGKGLKQAIRDLRAVLKSLREPFTGCLDDWCLDD